MTRLDDVGKVGSPALISPRACAPHRQRTPHRSKIQGGHLVVRASDRRDDRAMPDTPTTPPPWWTAFLEDPAEDGTLDAAIVSEDGAESAPSRSRVTETASD